MSAAVVVFARNPGAEPVKTRLQPPLSGTQAERLYRAFIADTAARMQALECPVRWYVSPRREAFPEDVPPEQLFVQRGRDLGTRMLRAVEETRRSGAEGVVLIGTDSPNLPSGHIRNALDQVSCPGSAVLGPALDGGYYLLGLNGIHPGFLTHISYSQPTVFEVTRAAIQQAAGLACTVLDPWYDVDNAVDLLRLASDLRSDATEAPHTAALLGTSEWRDLISSVEGRASRAL